MVEYHFILAGDTGSFVQMICSKDMPGIKNNNE